MAGDAAVSDFVGNDDLDLAQAHLEEREARHAALRHIIDAWEEALLDGLHPQQMASAMLFAAISELVVAHGEEQVAAMMERLPERIRRGEYTLCETRH